jgi:sulfur carrier protein
MKIRMNGEIIDIPSESNIDDLCKLFGLSQKGAVISVNGEVVRKSDYSMYVLQDSSTVEVMVFVGGG